jgi:hypothetical protein
MAALPENIVDRLRDMQRKIQQLTIEARYRPALTRVLGDLVITGGGRLLAYRKDGSLAAGLSSADSNQWFGIWDRFQRLVVSDDTATGGLARPYVPIPLYPAPVPVTSASWTRVLQGGMYLQHPRIAVGVWVAAAASTTVEARVMYLNSAGVSTQLGNTITVTNQALTQEVHGLHDQPAFTWSNLYVEARRTVGTGAVSAGVLYAEGRQT